MEDIKLSNDSLEDFHVFPPPPRSPQSERTVPDVPEDIDFYMEHLNDPNYDLKSWGPSATNDVELVARVSGNDTSTYAASTTDVQSSFASKKGLSLKTTTENTEPEDFNDESPYPEVRAAVSSTDDPSIPVNTFRMWFLGIFFSLLVSGLNQLFLMRYPSIFISGIVIQLISLPCGKLLEAILPTKKFNTFGFTWSLNPGPFSLKEHVCITVMANVSVGGAYATEVIITQRVFYRHELSYAYEALLALGTQTLGFSLAGMLRQFVVWPQSMIWPGALVNSALFNTLHKTYGIRDRGHMTRQRFFAIAAVASFVWYWVPGYLFTALSFFNWVCWIAPENVVVNSLFGLNTGLGMGILTFDWSMIAFIGSPLVTPWWSELNTAVSFVIWFWILVPILYFTNTFFTSHLPISTYLAFDNTGLPYDVSAVVTNGFFDISKYRSYSPVFLPATVCVAYCVAFASFPAVFVHTIIWHGNDIARRLRRSLKDERDVHSRLMQAYTEVPLWWYGVIGVASFLLISIAVDLFPTQLPLWGICVAFLLVIILVIPLGMIQAMTNQQVPLQVVHELIAGYILPNRPIANIIFKTIAFAGTTQAVGFAGDLKLGHYMKIPPRTMFTIQVVAVVIASLVAVSVQDWMFNNVNDICTPIQKQGFVCPSANVFATASLIWGGVGPSRLFNANRMYNPLVWFFLIGAMLPIPFYFLARRFPLSNFRYINIPVFFAGVGAIPPGSGINYASWAIVGFIFNYCIRRFHFRWWMRYNYILSAALDTGVALGMVAIFFLVRLPTGNHEIDWIGNNIWLKTADAMGIPLRPMQPGEVFGPTTWT